MKASRQTLATCIATFLIASGACSDSGGGGSGVSSSKKPSALTDEEARTLCTWTYEQATSIDLSDRDLCEVSAVSFADSASDCKALVDACLKDPSKPETDEGPDCGDASAKGFPARCDEINVGDYESCMRGLVATFKRAITDVSCASPDQPEFLDADNLPKACEKIRKTCPELLDFEDSESSDDGDTLIST